MYDGHDNYAEVVLKEVSAGPIAPLVEDNLHLSQFAWMLLSKLQLLLALGVGGLCFYRAMLWVDENLRGEWGFAGVLLLLAIMFMSLICGMVFHYATKVILRHLPRWKTLVAINGVALLAVGVGLVAPIQQGLAAKAQEKQQKLERLKQARPMQVSVEGSYPVLARRHQNWQKRMYRMRTHDAPGVVPPMLIVGDEGRMVLISHNRTHALHVALARVRLSGVDADVWEGCSLAPVGESVRPRFLEKWGGQQRWSYRIEPGQAILFELHPDCAADYAGAPIEYRVGVYADDDGWWSDSALAEPLPAYQLETRKTR
jgi:hypothetical protein